MVATELIVAMGAVMVAIINGIFMLASQRSQKKTNSDLSGKMNVITKEVKNSHPSNLRDDMDKQYLLLLRVAERVDRTSDDVREVRKATGKLFNLDREKADQIKSIEERVNAIPPHLPYPPYRPSPTQCERNNDV